MTSGVFTLPLFAMDAASGSDSSWAHDGSWGFIAGPENALLKALVRTADSDLPQFNPLTLYGPTGVGKSHLLLGVLNQFRARPSNRKCCYLTGADFARQYSHSVELDSLPEMRDKLAGARLLIIDGLDELSSKPAALHEIVQILDRAIERQNQLLFSCQAAISQWTWMPAALRSRLEGGLILPVAPPSEATRAAIVQRLQTELGLEPADSLGLTGRSNAFQPTFRDLKHEVLQSAAGNEEANRDVASSAAPSNGLAAVKRISKLVARQFEIKYSELIGPSRRKTVAQARGVAIYLVRSHLGISFDQLGKIFGDRDHTTILHAYHKTAALLENDNLLKQTIERLSAQLRRSI